MDKICCKHYVTLQVPNSDTKKLAYLFNNSRHLVKNDIAQSLSIGDKYTCEEKYTFSVTWTMIALILQSVANITGQTTYHCRQLNGVTGNETIKVPIKTMKNLINLLKDIALATKKLEQ